MDDQLALDTYDSYALQGEYLPPEEILSALIEGDRVFFATGTARVKVGSKVVQIPIRSVDMEEAGKRMASKRPHPPTERVLIRADSEDGKRGGLTQNKWVSLAKEADPGYIEALKQYNIHLGYLVMLLGLDMILKDRQGNVLWDPNDEERQDVEGAIRILRGMGLSQWQFIAIVDAINGLTQFEEEAQAKN